MQIENVKLNDILPNPYQPRESEDAGHIKALALSIAEQGLLQIPLARPCADGLYQLAFGHSRLAAYKWLRDVQANSNIPGDWTTMPLIVTEIDDEDMFIRGVRENNDRKNLNPIEVAKSMLIYRDKFGKTSAEIGKLFNLSDSAVRNKMRLLGLPDALQDSLRAGEITEGQGRALVPLYDIPEALRLAAEDSDELKPSEIIEAAKSGISPDRVAEMVNRLARRINPQPEQPTFIAPPAPIASSVSVETVDELVEEPEEVRAYDPAPDLEKEPPRPVVAPRPPAPAPIPTPARPAAPAPAQPAPKPQPQPAPVSQAASYRPTQPDPAPAQTAPAPAAPVPAPAAALSWEQSTLQVSLTIYPADANGGRMVMIGGRRNQDAPIMALATLADLALPAQIESIINRLHTEL